MALKPLVWWRFPDPWDEPGDDWTVWLTTARLTEELGGPPRLWGLTSWLPRYIYIDAGQPLNVLQETACHELHHVAYGDKRAKPWQRSKEERFIARVSPRLWEMGIVKLPRLPRGFKALRRSALRLARREEEEAA